MYRLLVLLVPMFLHAEDIQDQKISDISVEDLTNIVRMVVQETLAYCMVTGDARPVSYTHLRAHET